MSDIAMFDPTLFGAWPSAGAGAHRDAWGEERCREAAARVVLETKAAEAPAEALRVLMNDMTQEMRDQFAYFRRLREAAEALDGDADDAAAKLARADVKAATDAMSLIVRTLEKVDGLQRQLARDRDLEAERNADDTGYEDAKTRLLDLIEQKAQERVAVLLAQRGHDFADGGCAAAGVRASADGSVAIGPDPGPDTNTDAGRTISGSPCTGPPTTPGKP